MIELTSQSNKQNVKSVIYFAMMEMADLFQMRVGREGKSNVAGLSVHMCWFAVTNTHFSLDAMETCFSGMKTSCLLIHFAINSRCSASQELDHILLLHGTHHSSCFCINSILQRLSETSKEKNLL